jgi:hypothetical protein
MELMSSQAADFAKASDGMKRDNDRLTELLHSKAVDFDKLTEAYEAESRDIKAR